MREAPWTRASSFRACAFKDELLGNWSNRPRSAPAAVVSLPGGQEGRCAMRDYKWS